MRRFRDAVGISEKGDGLDDRTSSMREEEEEDARWSADERGVMRFVRLCARRTTEIQPVCETCSSKHYESLTRELGRNKIVQKRYHDFLRDLVRRNVASGEGGRRSRSTLCEDGEEEEIASLEKRLRTAMASRREIEAETDQLKAAIRSMESRSKACFEKIRTHDVVLTELKTRNESLVDRRKVLTERLACLKHTNVYNDAFFIWFDGPFGTINNFRLGRLPSQPVEYAEINAAWGQAAMLLATLEKRHKGFKFQRFRIVPVGSYSRLAPNGELSKPLPLFWDGGWRKGPYNRAMVAILNCLDELCIYATTNDRTIHMPYAIRGKTIGGHTIELGDWYRWTCASKYFLTNLKWLVAWSCKQ